MPGRRLFAAFLLLCLLSACTAQPPAMSSAAQNTRTTPLAVVKRPLTAEEVRDFLRDEDSQLMWHIAGLRSSRETSAAYAGVTFSYCIPFSIPFISDDLTAEYRNVVWYIPVFDADDRIVLMGAGWRSERAGFAVSTTSEFVPGLNGFFDEYGPRPLRVVQYHKVCYALDADGHALCLNPDRWGQQGGDPSFDLTLSDAEIRAILAVTEDSIVFDEVHKVPLPEGADP